MVLKLNTQLSGNLSLGELVKIIYNRHGILGFWAGCSAKLIATSVHSLIASSCSKYIKTKLLDSFQSNLVHYPRQEHADLLKQAVRNYLPIATVVGNIIASIAQLPFDIWSIELQTATALQGKIPPTLAVGRLLIERYGLRLLTIGLIPQLLKNLIYSTTASVILIRL